MKKFVATVRYYLDGKEVSDKIPDFARNVLDEWFLYYRQKIVDELNPRYEAWNEEFNRRYPDASGYSREYAEFLWEKSKQYYDAVNKNSKHIKFYQSMDPDEAGDIEAHLGDIRIIMTLKPVEVK